MLYLSIENYFLKHFIVAVVLIFFWLIIVIYEIVIPQFRLPYLVTDTMAYKYPLYMTEYFYFTFQSK